MSDDPIGPKARGGDAQGYEPRPRWVTVLVVVAAAVALLVVVILVSGGEHGPGRHMGEPSGSVPAVVGVASGGMR